MNATAPSRALRRTAWRESWQLLRLPETANERPLNRWQRRRAEALARRPQPDEPSPVQELQSNVGFTGDPNWGSRPSLWTRCKLWLSRFFT